MNDATHSSQVQTINDYRDSVEPQLAFVGLFDVLGFKSRLSDHGLDEVRSGYRQLVDRKVDAGVVPVFSGAGGTYRRLATTIFSDTILLWCIDEWEAVQTLVTGAAYLLATAVDMRWPLRGALAYGQCVLDRQSRTFIGQPIIEAYEAEQAQEWVGAALTSSVTCHPLLGARVQSLEDVVEYPVPVKDGHHALTHALHWCPYSSRASVELDASFVIVQ